VTGDRNILQTIKRKAYWIRSLLPQNYFLTFVIKEKLQGRIIEVTEGRKHLLDDFKAKVLETERGSTRSHSVENSIWKWL